MSRRQPGVARVGLFLTSCVCYAWPGAADATSQPPQQEDRQVLIQSILDDALVFRDVVGSDSKKRRYPPIIRKNGKVHFEVALTSGLVERLAKLTDANKQRVTEACMGVRLLHAQPADANGCTVTPTWKTSVIHLNSSKPQMVLVPECEGQQFRYEAVVDTTYRQCVNDGQADLAREGSRVVPVTRSEKESGFNLTFSDAILLVGVTSLAPMADGTDRRYQTFRVGGNAFFFDETAGLPAYLGLNLTLMDFNHTGTALKEPGIGLVVAPTFLKRSVFVGAGWNLAQPSPVFDPAQPNNLTRLRHRGYLFFGVSGVGFKNWLDSLKTE